MSAFTYPGPHCQQACISCHTLLSARRLKRLTEVVLSKGILIELNDFRQEHDISWHIFHQWIIQLKGDVNLAYLKVSMSRLNKKRAELIRNKEHTKLEELMKQQHFSSPKKADCEADSYI